MSLVGELGRERDDSRDVRSEITQPFRPYVGRPNVWCQSCRCSRMKRLHIGLTSSRSSDKPRYR
jgi:hypothetical protein